jgi:hypothetical protein
MIGELKEASRMAAKVDSALVQDGYQLYHHVLFFTESGKWAVVQQGMSDSYARRYHWLSDGVKSFVEEPHSGICAEVQETSVLDLTARESRENRKTTLDLVRDGPSCILKYTAQRTLFDFSDRPRDELGQSHNASAPEKIKELILPSRHEVLPVDIGKKGMDALKIAYELQPESYEELISLKGMGPRRIRALALISELIYGASASWEDPARFSFAHGGKDGHPYPVDRETYDHSIATLIEALDAAKLDDREKYNAIRRLSRYTGE